MSDSFRQFFSEMCHCNKQHKRTHNLQHNLLQTGCHYSPKLHGFEGKINAQEADSSVSKIGKYKRMAC